MDSKDEDEEGCFIPQTEEMWAMKEELVWGETTRDRPFLRCGGRVLIRRWSASHAVVDKAQGDSRFPTRIHNWTNFNYISAGEFPTPLGAHARPRFT